MPPRVLIAVPAFNEEATIETVVERVRTDAPAFDLLVVNDGSRDGTAAVLRRLNVHCATHLCNLGYGRALQTAIGYARAAGYDALITFDADGQHRASDIPKLYDAFEAGKYDLLIGSRFLAAGNYSTEPFVRRIGMRVFSSLLAVATGRRIYDTSSGLKVIGRDVFALLGTRPFVDFHAEVLFYLLVERRRVAEFPVSVEPRRHGTSMYNTLSALKYPLKVIFLLFVGMVDTLLIRRRRDV